VVEDDSDIDRDVEGEAEAEETVGSDEVVD